MNIQTTFWGTGEELNILQTAVRAFVMFFITLALIRLGGMRVFAKKSAFDTIIIIMMGAVLARVITGNAPFIPTVAGSAVMVAVNKLLAWLSVKNVHLNRLIKGQSIRLFHDGKIDWKNMERACLSYSDLMESLRLETLKDSFADIETAYLETNGRISFIEKKIME
jgi:uncharacterized membrane protein YcaP (DUF421 family)